MKKAFLAIILSFVLILSACSGNTVVSADAIADSTTGQTTALSTQTGSSILNTSYDNAVSIAEQLALGTLNLDGTANAITKDQAATLVTQWLSLQELTQKNMPGQGGMPGQGSGAPGQGSGANSSQQPPSQGSADSSFPNASGTAVPESSTKTLPTPSTDQSSTLAAPQKSGTDTQTQVDAILAKIEAVMTANQLKAIAALQITQSNAATIMQAKGITTTADGQQGNGGTPPQGTPPSGKSTSSGTPEAMSTPNGTKAAMSAPSGTQSANSQQSGNGQKGPGAGPMGKTSNQIQPQLMSAVLKYLANLAGVTLPTAQPQSQAKGGAQPQGNNGGGTSTAITSVTATYTVDGKEESQSGQTYNAAAKDTSPVFVTNAGKLTLSNATVTSSGNSSSTDNSSFYGLNSGILVNQAAALVMSGSKVTTSGIGANGVFSSGTGSTVTLSDVTINATGDGAHAVMATLGGTMTLTNVNMTTTGGSASAIATDRGSGTINVTGGTVNTSGNNSADIYSTGAITVNSATMTSSGAEAAVIEGANSITLTDTKLTSTKQNKWGVMIYQSFSGDAEGSEGTFTMSGGSLNLSAIGGPLFYVTNTTGNIALKNVAVSVASGTLLKASSGDWGNSGSNGGNAVVTADSQTLTGNVVADNVSTVKLTLQNASTLTGYLNTEHTAKQMELTLDSTSLWNVTADSYLSCLTDASGISGSSITNINGNDHTVYYDSTSCTALNGLTYSLKGEGTLQPVK